MDTSTPLMCLCRRRAGESYCTGNPTTQFSLFFFYCHIVHASMGHASILRGRGIVECDSWILYFPPWSWTMPVSRPFPHPTWNYVVKPWCAYGAINLMNEKAKLYKFKKFIKITFWVYSNNKVEYNLLSMHWLRLKMNKSNTGMIWLYNKQTKYIKMTHKMMNLNIKTLKLQYSITP